MADTYQPSLVKEVEVARTAINTAFLMSKPAYEAYYQESMNHAELKNFIAAMDNAESEEQKKEIYNALSSEERKVVDEFFNGEKSKQIIDGLASKGLAWMKTGEQKAREQALLDAMRNAVQQVQGVMLSGMSGMFNEALSFALSSKTEGYVSHYEILEEDIARGNYQVLILAQVNGGKLLKDVNFYLDIFADPMFSIVTGNGDKASWLARELEGLGFALHQGHQKPTHTFFLTERQQPVKNHNGKTGIETALTLQLKDNKTGLVLFTIKNNPLKARIYVTPMERAKQVSAVSAYKTLGKQLGPEIVTALAKHAEKGRIHKIEIRNARRNDWQLFRHVLDNGTAGSVEGWEWSKNGKTMVLNYRYRGKLSSAMNEGLESLYQSYRKEGNGRRPTAISITDGRAIFEMIRG